MKSIAVAGKQSKGANQGLRSVLTPMVHLDTWLLKLSQPPSDGVSSSPPIVRWERRKRPANSPNPPRAGATMAYHKGRGIMFGGVHDVEESEEGIDSEFFDTLFAWNIERNRFFQLTLRRPRGPSKRQQTMERAVGRRGRGKADEMDLLKNLAALETKGSIADMNEMDMENSVEQGPEVKKPMCPVIMSLPRPRFNAQLAVQDDVLYIFGGTYEHGDREYTFDELWAIDLGKLDGVKQIFCREVENWHDSEDEDSDSQDGEDDTGSEDEDMDDEYSSGVLLPCVEPEIIPASFKDTVFERAPDVEEIEPEHAAMDTRPYPRPFESLREFFTRTSNEWQDILLEVLRRGDSNANKAVKELRKAAFELAETKWWDCREEITALEDQQEEAGIGEVVSIADRGSEVGGSGRRR